MSISVQPINDFEKDPTVSDPNKDSGGSGHWYDPHPEADEFAERERQREEARERRRERERQRDREREQSRLPNGDLEEMPEIINDVDPERERERDPEPEPEAGTDTGNGDFSDDDANDSFGNQLAKMFEGSGTVIVPPVAGATSSGGGMGIVTVLLIAGAVGVGAWYFATRSG